MTAMLKEGEPASPKSISKLSADELRQLLLAAMVVFPQMETWVQARLAQPEEDATAYRQLIRSTLHAHTRRGSVAYHDTENATQGAWEALQHLSTLVTTGDVLHAVDFALMLLHEGMNLMEACCDDDGDVGMMIEESLSHLDTLNQSRLCCAQEAVRSTVYYRLMDAAFSSLFSGWDDWRDRLIGICASIADTNPSLRPRILALYQAEASAKGEHSYKQASAQLVLFDLLQRWESEGVAWDFLMAHLSNSDFRDKAIDHYTKASDFERALSLCIEGEAQDAQKAGLLFRWKERRCALYEAMGDTVQMKKLAEEMLLSDHIEYYAKLKLLYPAEAWPKQRESLLVAFEAQARSYKPSAYLTIIQEERDQPRLLKVVQASPDSVFRFCDALLLEHGEEVQAAFEKTILAQAQRANDRSGYEQVCHRLNDYAKTCGSAKATVFLSTLKGLYPRRPAFQNELSKQAQYMRLSQKDNKRSHVL